MREIKFKIWSQFQGGKMILPNEIGFYEKSFLHDNGHWQTSSLHSLLKREDVKVMQYSGLKDKNGSEIYEGDCFVKLVSYINLEEKTKKFAKEVCVVKFNDGKFMVYQDGWGYFELLDVINQKNDEYDRWESGEIIGNIYENPELLEVK